MCSQAQLIFERLKEDVGKMAKNEELKASNGWFSQPNRALKNKAKASLPVIQKSNCKACVTTSVFEDSLGYQFIPEVRYYY